MRFAITFALALGALPLLATGCDSAGGDTGSYTLTLLDEPFSGTSVDCKVNTSYPQGDPLRGKFFVSANNYEDRGFSALVHFVNFEAAPTPGTYTAGDGVAVQASYTDPDDGPLGGVIDSGSLTVEETGSGLRLTFVSTPGLTGTITCPSN